MRALELDVPMTVVVNNKAEGSAPYSVEMNLVHARIDGSGFVVEVRNVATLTITS